MLTRPPSLRRYTQLPSLIYMLQERTLTLLDPQTWDDSNDSHYIALYKLRKKLKSVLALCFTAASETYHHWRVFAPGSSGVCVEFRGPTLIDAVKRPGLRAEPVRYLTLTESRHTKLAAHELPFLKRYPYQQEQEFRFLYQSTSRTLSSLDLPLELHYISKIIISPWLHSTLAERVKVLLRSIDGCSGIKVNHSTLIGNDDWKKLGEAAA